MLDFFDEKYWWNQKVEWDGKVTLPAFSLKPKYPDRFHLTWCARHNYYYTKEEGQTCLRCDDEEAEQRLRRGGDRSRKKD